MNNFLINFVARVCLLLSLLVGTTSQLRADEQSDLLRQFLTDDVVAVGYLDLDKIDPTEITQLFRGFGVTGIELKGIEAAAAHAKSELAKLTSAGVRFVYVLLRTSDIGQLGTSWVASVNEGKDAGQAVEVVRQFVANAKLGELLAQVKTVDGVVVAAANANQIARMVNNSPANPRDLSMPMEALGKGAFGIILIGDADSRRVVRELVPNLPTPFETVTGKLVADDMLWGGLKLNWPPSLSLKLEVECRNPETAKFVARALENATDALAQSTTFQSTLKDPADQQMVCDAVRPIVNQNRVTVSLDAVTGDLQRLTRVIAGPVQELRQAARVSAEMNNVRQLMLAFHNYESAMGQFPNPSGVTENTPAGLSWRVQILPFMELGELYGKFKLDESWDSDHNLKLVAEMPEIFRSPLVKDAAIHAEGKTVYQVPIAEEAMFKPNNRDNAPVKFGDLVDGSSNTICIVTVDEREAATWTQPDDWEVDMNNPSKGLTGGRELVIVALADASSHAFPMTIKPETWRALITSNGGELIPSPVK